MPSAQESTRQRWPKEFALNMKREQTKAQRPEEDAAPAKAARLLVAVSPRALRRGV